MSCRAARLVEHGKSLVVGDVDLPKPAEDEAVVDMAYGGVNPVDRYGALGRVAPDAPLPRTLGTEGSGWVDGRAVVVRGNGFGTERDGLWATQAVVPTEALVEIPDGVDLEAAAAMGVAGVTAWRVVTEKAKVAEGDRVLIFGAAGGVGSIAVSVASALGATVWGQTSNPDKANWIVERGADHVVVGNASALVDEAGEFRPTVVIDPLGDGFTGAGLEILEPRGRLVIFGTSAAPEGTVPLQKLYGKALTVYGYAGLIEDDEVLAKHVVDALDAVRDRRLEVVVGRTVPIEEVNDAFELLEQRSVQGQVLLDLRQ
jgi:NADPH2:quinone reductase